MNKPANNLTRPIHPMSAFVEDALKKAGIAAAHEAWPAYQQNDYIGWIMNAKRLETRQKRLGQMFGELRVGGIYMWMDHPPSQP